MKNSVKHIELLDFLRGVAIAAVLVFHTLGMAFGYDALPWKGWLRDFSGQTAFTCFLPVGLLAQAGVAIFFVVSGFCIHLSFEGQGKDWRNFFTRRFFRIYPPYLLALIFSLAILAINPGLNFSSGEFWKQTLSHVFLIHNFSLDTVWGINAAMWSLAVEAQLYLLYPLLLLLTRKLGWRQSMGISAACELLIRGLDGATQSLSGANTIGGHIIWVLASSPLGYWFSWALGAFIAEAWLKREPLPFRNASPLAWLSLAFAAYFLKPLYTFQFLLFAVATAAFAGRSLARDSESRAPWYLTAPVKKIGLWSYSIYLLHQPLLHLYSHIIVWAVPGEYRPAPIAFFLMMATWLVIIPFSISWYKVIEVSSIAIGKKLQKGSRPDAPKAPSVASPPSSGMKVQPCSGGSYAFILAVLLFFICGSLWVSDRFSYRWAERSIERAWTLATDPDPGKRNGALAVNLAEDACLQAHYQDPHMVGTLAAAYAEAGRFDEAVGAAQMACGLAAKMSDEKLLQANQDLLNHFVRHEAFRDGSSGTNASAGAAKQ